MNAPAELKLRDVALEDKYEAADGPVFITGTQALVRLPMLQRALDLAAGYNTAGYITGYRGSPVGGYDQALWKARKHLEAHHIKFEPGTNEDLAATALWGTQQMHCFGDSRYDGVFGIWYGKGPGVDRSGDVFRHANQAGSAPLGGVLAVAGDDHGAKSSTVAAQTDYIFQAVSIPVLAAAQLQDYIDLGLHGLAMSRFAGVWVGLKAVTDTIEVAGVADVSLARLQFKRPEFAMPAGGLNLRWPEDTFPKLEERLVRYKMPAVLAYARANRLDAAVLGRGAGESARLGIVSSGKAYLDLRQMLADIGLDDMTARRIGLRVYKVAMPWPLEPEGLREFAAGCEALWIVEEKRGLVEGQAREHLYALAQRPGIAGKRVDPGLALEALPEAGELSAASLTPVLAQWLREAAKRTDDASGACDRALLERVEKRLQQLAAPPVVASALKGIDTNAVSVERIPYFCSGCPHNTSTKVPEGSRALAGIGCHYMAQWMDRSTATFTQMGGEGMTWVGQAPFSTTEHVFQNLGDGTYFHSGSLAIRHAVASKTRMTYKILFNDAVAMTGGQRHDGPLTPARIAEQVRAEGVGKIVVVTDEPHKYPPNYFASDVVVFDRATLDQVQRELRDYDGVSVLIYDQTCAAEKRRRRKRGEFPDPAKRVVINPEVCEGCGDCGVQSNCVSIEPLDTELGRKRRINQSSCNKDFSCVNGFCPSFVTVEGGQLRKPVVAGKAGSAKAGASQDAVLALELAFNGLPAPELPAMVNSYGLLVTGIGGTGVVTIGQILGMAAHLEHKAVSVLDMAGLAQKNGAVMSFVRFAHGPDELHAPRIGQAGADAVIGGDLVVAAGREAFAKLARGRTRLVGNLAQTPTADFTRNVNWSFPLTRLRTKLNEALGDEATWYMDANRLAVALLGDTIAANLMMLGAAYQRGLVPLQARSIERAIELNAVSVRMNLAAFRWGRRMVVDPAAVEQAAGARLDAGPGQAGSASPAADAGTSPMIDPLGEGSLQALIDDRIKRLVAYQNRAYAKRYEDFVTQVHSLEKPWGGADGAEGSQAQWPVTAAAARYGYKLMAFKDEYEVARLHTDARFVRQIVQMFEGDIQVNFHLAPPLLAKRNAQGQLIKQRFGPWMKLVFSGLARLRFLRGTALDVFGYTEERRMERALMVDYQRELIEMMGALGSTPQASQREALSRWAKVPEEIRGYGHVKERNVEQARQRWQELRAQVLIMQGEPSKVLA
jgi:indolepyruvate ferredoxin oxidoreductase